MAAALVIGLAATGLAATPASAADTIYPSFSSAFNNAGIATNANPSIADLDGAGNSLSADALNAAGWTRGANVTVNATTYTLPDVAPGQPDNIIADQQTVPVSGSGNALGFLLTSTGGAVSGSGRSTTATAPPRHTISTRSETGPQAAPSWPLSS